MPITADGTRRAGRTTRFLQHAIDLALEKRPVFFVSHCEGTSREHAERCIDLLVERRVAHSVSLPTLTITLDRGGSLRFVALATHVTTGAALRPSFGQDNRDPRLDNAGATLKREGRIVIDHHALIQLERSERMERARAEQ